MQHTLCTKFPKDPLVSAALHLHAVVRFVGDEGETETSVFFLKEPLGGCFARGAPYWLPQRKHTYRHSRRRKDGWREIELGLFSNDRGEDYDEVMMQLMEVDSGHERAGLVLEGIEVRPKEKVANRAA